MVWRGDAIPSRHFAEFVRNLLLATPTINPKIHAALRMDKPNTVHWSVLDNGRLALLNFNGRSATVKFANGKQLTIPPYEPATALSW